MKHEKNDEGMYEAKIGDEVYAFEKWDAEESLDVLLEIARIIGKPLGAMVGTMMTGQKLDQEMDPNMLATIFEGLTQSFDKKVVKEIIIRVTSRRVLCDGAKIEFKIHYQEKLDVMFQVLKAGLEVQYGNFFAALLGVVGAKSPRGIKNKGR